MWLLPPLLLLIIPGSFCISGPPSARGSRGDSLTVRCHYDAGWETYHKWWCCGEARRSCEILVTTTGSEHRVQRGRVAIQDDHGRNTFTVTTEALRESDADTYWCGIQRSGANPGHQVRVSVDPAKPETPHPPVALTSSAPARLGVSPPIVQSGNSSLSLARSLLCNIHFVLLTFLKVPLLVGLLCTVMWLSRQPAEAQGNELRLRGKPAAPLPPTPRLEPAEPADRFSGNKQGSPFQKRGGSPLGPGAPSSWLQGRSRHSPAPWPPAQEQRAEQRRGSPYTPGPRRHPQPQPCGSSRGPLSGDYEVALPVGGGDTV
ncbi:CD300 molecule like family member b [Phyllostomus discolor]|uniref:CD300 molecule like family member b n=1 Tax=Phyllostomus discolor TaxID=89673 RepID=A0A833ZFG5_9CHIR|nr:CD300 molecule like family member b [Phyllostomus discolor]